MDFNTISPLVFAISLLSLSFIIGKIFYKRSIKSDIQFNKEMVELSKPPVNLFNK
jgi:hypothetical protein